METLISPIKGCSQLRINQLLTIYQGVHFTYFAVSILGAFYKTNKYNLEICEKLPERM